MSQPILQKDTIAEAVSIERTDSIFLFLFLRKSAIRLTKMLFHHNIREQAVEKDYANLCISREKPIFVQICSLTPKLHE